MVIVIIAAVLAVTVGSLVFTVLALVDSIRRPTRAWVEAGRSRVLWILGILVLPLVGPWFYWTVVRPQLAATGQP